MQCNRVEVAGYLAAKPSLRYMPSGVAVANARLGETYRYTDSVGAVHKQTNWHSLSFYDQMARVAATFEQGDNIFVEGRIQQRKFTPADGTPRTVHEIVVRKCHRVAENRELDMPELVGEQPVEQETKSGAGDDWPVG